MLTTSGIIINIMKININIIVIIIIIIIIIDLILFKMSYKLFF